MLKFQLYFETIPTYSIQFENIKNLYMPKPISLKVHPAVQVNTIVFC